MQGAFFLRSEKLLNESFPNFSNFRPEFCPEFCSEFSPNFRGYFVLRFVETETRKNSLKIPTFFQCKIPRQTRKNITKFFWRAGKSNFSCFQTRNGQDVPQFGRDVLGSEKLYARKLWTGFLFLLKGLESRAQNEKTDHAQQQPTLGRTSQNLLDLPKTLRENCRTSPPGLPLENQGVFFGQCQTPP